MARVSLTTAPPHAPCSAPPLPAGPCPVCPRLAQEFEPWRQASYWKAMHERAVREAVQAQITEIAPLVVDQVPAHDRLGRGMALRRADEAEETRGGLPMVEPEELRILALERIREVLAN